MKRFVVVCALALALLFGTTAMPAHAVCGGEACFPGCAKYDATLAYTVPPSISPYYTADTGYQTVYWPPDHSLPAIGLGKNAGQWNPNAPPWSDHNIEAGDGSRRGFRQQTMGYSQVYTYDFTHNGYAHQCKWFGWMAVGGPDGGSVYSVTYIWSSV